MVTLVSSSDIPLNNNGFGSQLWGDEVTLSAFDWYGNPAAVIYDTQFIVPGFGIAGGRYNQIDFHETFGNLTERMEINFNGAVTDVVVTFGQLESNERGGRRESGKWTAYGLNGEKVAEGLFNSSYSLLGPDVGVDGSTKIFPIAFNSTEPFSKIVIEADDFDNGEGKDPFFKEGNSYSYLDGPYEENSDFNIREVSYTRLSYTSTNNSSPIVVNDIFVVDEDTELTDNVLINDTDPDGDLLSVSLSGGAKNGSLSLFIDGTFTYTPNENFSGDDSFTYQAFDGQGGFSQGVVVITINPVNDAPVAVADKVSVKGNTDLLIDVAANDFDVDGNLDFESAVLIESANNGSVLNLGNGIFSYTPGADFIGDDSFSYQISDTLGDSSEVATVTVTVTANTPPTATDDALNTQQDISLTFNVLDNDADADGDSLNLTGFDVDLGSFNGVLVNNGSGNFTYTPDAGFVGTDTFNYTIEDGDGGFDTATVAITVANQPSRVRDQLLALYTFDEGSGDIVRDVSGVGTALDLVINDPGNVIWEEGTLSVNASTLIATEGAATKLIDGLTGTNEITIEAWLSTDNLTQGGPARIATLSDSTRQRNFTLGQEGDAFNVRLRTTDNTLNGNKPSVSSPKGVIVSNAMTHIVYTRDINGLANLYINNELVQSQSISGDFSNWDSSFRFGLANEFNSDRPWLGQYDYLAIYSQSFDSNEVAQNFFAGSLV